jgi:hypothetical protein
MIMIVRVPRYPQAQRESGQTNLDITISRFVRHGAVLNIGFFAQGEQPEG